MKSELHKLLTRQLTRYELSRDALPNLQQWQEFLERINCAYFEADQELYLLERSLEISSREMQELTEKLETAQKIARLGYWLYDIANKKNIWSKEIYLMFGLDFKEPVPTLDRILELTHIQDRPLFGNLIKKAFSQGLSFEADLRLQKLNHGNEYRWYHLIGHPVKKTGKLVEQLGGIIMDINQRKLVEEEVKQLQQQLVTSARRAGMADVATSILHNVGNILNSATVSNNLIIEHMQQPYLNKIDAIHQMIKENISNLADYFQNDSKGKLIPAYLSGIVEEISKVKKNVLDEAENLKINIKHIREITSWQKSLSGVVGLSENIYLPEIIDLAIKMCAPNLEKHGISVNKSFDGNLNIITNRNKLLQILVNLVQNAKESLLAAKVDREKKISFVVKENSLNMEIEVVDNGIGISADTLKNIFTFGFTTKKTGHGFGLHSSAIAAKELGGKLIGVSEGNLQGAKFILTLPLGIQHEGDSNHGN